MSETFEEWYIELRRLYDLAEAEEMTGEDLLTVLITTGIRDEKVTSKILEDLRTPTLDDTVKLIEKMTFAKDTNARIEKRREDSKVAAVGKRNTKTLYQKDKEYRRLEKTPKNEKGKTSDFSKYFNCGRDRHPSTGKPGGWKINCPASKTTGLDCKKYGHSAKTVACKAKKVSCVKMGSVNCARSTNIVEISAIGPEKCHPIKVEADTGANITVFKAESLQEMAWVELEQTEMQIQGYSGIAETCVGKAMIKLPFVSRI